jgi:ubiquinone/menaquinone biosynthesis C-methylase UbiE
VHDYLSRMNIPVTSADIDPDLKPDVVADITHLPFPAKVFGTVIACEVLEHIPFPDAKRALVELARIADYAVISVPDCNRSGSLTVQLPRFGKWSLRVTSPRFLSRRDVLGKDQHYWELGTIDMPVRRLTQALNEAGWGILKHFRPIENAYHHFFILRHQG